MKTRILMGLILLLGISAVSNGQTPWLDRPLTTNWNNGNGNVPSAPRNASPIEGKCQEQIRTPESLADRAITRAGWSLFGATQSYGAVTVVMAMASVDGICRPNQYNGFVFVNNRFAGTLAPAPVNSRTDGAIGRVILNNQRELIAEFARYTSNDALCCPSQSSLVSYSISTGTRPILKADDVSTTAVCQTNETPEVPENAVTGTVTYRQRSALPPTAVLNIKLIDVSRADAPSTTIAEENIETAGKQVPIPFQLEYEARQIRERNRYAVRAEISDGGRLLFTTDTNYPVITQGNPKTVELTLVPVGSGTGPGRGSGVISGTVTYLQRIALPPNSEVTVRLMDSAEPEGTPVAETTFAVTTRQVPLPFELRYEQRDISRQKEYELQAEIRTEGTVRFRTERGQPVSLRGAPTANIALVLVPAASTPEVITGKSLNASKFGTGSMQIEGRGAELVVRGNVTIRTDGTATVSISRLNGTINFTGKLVAFDANSARITVESSGDADASGEIEIRYSGRSLNSITGNSLILDGQNVTLRF